MKEIKHCWGGSKSNALKTAKRVEDGNEKGTINPTIRRIESENYKKAWDANMKSSGFHEFGKSDELQAIVPDLIAEYVESKRIESQQQGRPFKPPGYLTALHVVKCNQWGMLTEEEKMEYDELARKAAAEYRSTLDR